MTIFLFCLISEMRSYSESTYRMRIIHLFAVMIFVFYICLLHFSTGFLKPLLEQVRQTDR
jgi:hypothetical protein